MTQQGTTRKLALAGVLTALAAAGSLISFPVAGSQCAPVQHMVNILAAVTMGPGWGVGIAFCASLLRNLLGPDGIPGQYDRCVLLRAGLCEVEKAWRMLSG